MLGRLTEWLWAVLVGFSRYVVNTIVAGLFWVVTGRGKLTRGDETFSSRVGRNAIQGKRWALLAEKIIDGFLGERHCRRSIEIGPHCRPGGC